MWQLMVLCATGIARMDIYCVLQYSHIRSKCDFWHDIADKGIRLLRAFLNVIFHTDVQQLARFQLT